MKATKFVIVSKSGIDQGPIEMLEETAGRFHRCTVIGAKPSHSVSGIAFREEIVGQPVFSALCGPMFGGEGVVRYETSAAYAELSR